MSFVGKIAKAAVGVVGGLLLGSKKKTAAAPQQGSALPTRNAAAELARGRDALARRRGTAANMILGARGAEASGVGAKTQLGT